MSVSPFVGRRQDLNLIDRCLEEARSGRPRVVLVQGDAGVGKTRLLQEVRPLAQRHGIEVCYGRCYEDLALPYLPFVESLRAQLLQIPEQVEHALGADMAVVNQFLHRTDIPSSALGPIRSAEADRDTLRLFLALTRATIVLAQHRPTALILDDLHWADRSSLDLLTHLVFAVADAAVREPVPLLIIGAHRPAEPEDRLARTIARLQREEICQTLPLSGLNEAEVDELIQSLEGTPPAHQLVTTVSEATRGNPLCIQEALHHLGQSGALHKRDGFLVATISPTDLRLPEQLTAAITVRIQALSPSCRTILTLASCLGDNFSLPVLSKINEEGEETLLNGLEEGIQQHLLTSERQTFQFAHPSIRQVLYTTAIPPRRQRMHLQAAQALERLYAPHLDAHLFEIAHHLIHAGMTAEGGKVIEYARRAGDQAFAIFAWGEAARYYEATLTTAEFSGALSAHDRGELHYLAGHARYMDMDVAPSLDHYEHALEAYRLAGDVRGEALVLIGKARAYSTQAAVPYGTLIDVQPLEEMLATLGDDEPALRGHLAATLAQAYWHARQPDKAEEMARRALALGRHLSDDVLCAYASHGLALAQMQSLHVQEALSSWQDARSYAQRAGDLRLQGWHLTRAPLTLSWLGQLEEAEELALVACEATRRVHNWAEYSMGLATRAAVAVVRGDFATAEQYAQETMRMVRRSHYPWGGASVVSALAYARVARGDWKEAEGAINLLIEPGRIFAEPGPAVQFVAWVYHQLIRAYSQPVDAGMEQVATNLLTMGGTDVNALGGFCALVEIADLTANPALAKIPYPALCLAEERGVLFASGWMFLIPRVLGVIAMHNCWWDKAERHFQKAIVAATTAGARPELGRSYLDYARMLVSWDKTRNHTHAIELLEQANSIFQELGMQPFAQRTARLAETFQAPVRVVQEQQPTYPDNLSESEAKVLLQVARGRTEQEIADALVVNPQTVAHHLSAVLRKTGVDGPQAAAAYVAEKSLASHLQPPLQVIFFSDIVGSTILVERLGDMKAREVFRAHNALIRACLREQSGVELQHTGDGFMASFASASAAIACAIAIQQAFTRYNQEHPDLSLHVRIGLNAGEPLAEEGRLFGAAVHAAARVCAQAQGDEILVSEVLRQLAVGKGFSLVDRGLFELKGFAEPFRLYAVHW